MKFRSAITGRWVTHLFAKKNPATTVSEKEKAATTASTGNWKPPWDADGKWDVSSAGLFIPCPYCDKLIQKGDKFCQWCQSEIDE
jgi:sarcosine oxidase delta subunit